MASAARRAHLPTADKLIPLASLTVLDTTNRFSTPGGLIEGRFRPTNPGDCAIPYTPHVPRATDTCLQLRVQLDGFPFQHGNGSANLVPDLCVSAVEKSGNSS